MDASFEMNKNTKAMKYVFLILMCMPFLLLLFGCNNRFRNEQYLNVNDSTAVRKFIDKNNICEQLRFIEKNKASLYDVASYSYLIPGNISKKTGLNLYVMVATGDVLLTVDQRNEVIQSQLDSFKNQMRCKK